MRRFYILILSACLLPHCVAPPEYSDGLLENIPAIVDASDYFSLSILGDQYTADHEWEVSLAPAESDVLLQTLVVKEFNSSSDSTYLLIKGADGDTILTALIMGDLNWSSEDSVSHIGFPGEIAFSGKNFTGRVEYQILKK